MRSSCQFSAVQPIIVPVQVDVLEGLAVVDGEHAEEALSRPHVLVTHGTVLLLACRVQDVQQARLTVDHHLLPVRVLQNKAPSTPQYHQSNP